MVDELEVLAREHGVKRVTFADSVLNCPPGHAEAICEEILARRLRIDWDAYFAIKPVTGEFVELARAAGCKTMLFSPDGLSDGALAGLGKGMTAAEVSEKLRLLREPRFADIEKVFCFFLGAPGETLGGWLRTLGFHVRAKLRRDRTWETSLAWVRLEPQTEAYRRALTEGAIGSTTPLLPETAAGLGATFYRHPRLDPLDRAVMAGLRGLRFGKRLAKRILRRGGGR